LDATQLGTMGGARPMGAFSMGSVRRLGAYSAGMRVDCGLTYITVQASIA